MNQACRPCRIHQIVSWTFQIIAAAILLQTLFFKFTGAEESVYIFTRLGAEPWGRIGSGVVELIAAGLLLSGRFSAVGGLVAAGVMGGAIMGHLTRLGIIVKDDGGLLFGLAWVVLTSGLIVAWLRRDSLPIIGPRIKSQAGCAAPPP
jgi:putative oxidoreductase